MQGARILHSYGTLVKGLGCTLWGVSPGVEVCSDDELDGGQVPGGGGGGGGGAGIGSVRFYLLVFFYVRFYLLVFVCVRFYLLCMGFR